MTSTKTPISDIATYLADAHTSDPLVVAAGPSADDADTFSEVRLRDALTESGWTDVNHWHIETLRIHLRAALQAEADLWAWADAQAEKATAARIEAAIDTLREASAGQVYRCEDGTVYQPREIETWVWVDDAELEQLGAAILSGEEDAYSLWAAQCGVALETTRDMPAETAILEAAGKGDER